MVKYNPENKIPKKISIKRNNPLFTGVEDNTQFYFVHSYFIEYNPTFDIAAVSYGNTFSAAIQKDNFYGVQFHPEKSATEGLRILENFVDTCSAVATSK